MSTKTLSRVKSAKGILEDLPRKTFMTRVLQHQQRVRILRLSLGVTLALTLAFAINWPLALLTPIFTTVFLSLPLPRPSLQKGLRNMLQTLFAFVLGIVFTLFVYPYPMLYLLLLAPALFFIYYNLNRGASFWLSLMLLLALLIMPMLTAMHEGLAIGFSMGFVWSGWYAVFILYLAYFLMPDPQHQAYPPAKKMNWEYSPMAAELALKSTVVVLPIVIMFITFQLSNLMVVMIFIAIFTLSPQLSKGKEAAQNSVISTLIGGTAALVFYFLLVAVPQLFFFIILAALTTLLFGMMIFSANPNAKYFSSALVAVILLLSSSLAEDKDFIENFAIRLTLISMAGLYVVLALKVLERYWPVVKRVQ